MFGSEFQTMDDTSVFPTAEGEETSAALSMDYAFHKMNFSPSDSGMQMFPMEECMELFGNLSSVPPHIACLDHAPVLEQSTIIKSFILSVMAILSLLGNVATMLSIQKSKRQRSAHIYTLIYHLSIADLFVTFWCILGEAIWSLTVEWKAGNIECKVFKFFQMFSLYLSTFIMVLIGVDRFIAVKYPLKSMRKGLCIRLIALCWSLSAFLSLPQMVVFHVKQGPFVEDFYQCVTYGFYTAEWQEHLYTVFTLVCNFLLPLFILVTTYILTVVTLHRNEEILDHTGSFRTLIDPNRRKLIRRAKMKSLRISVAIVAAFIICWTPYYVMMITYLFFVPNKEEIPSVEIYSGFFFFGMSNSLFNPLIYGIFHLWKPRRKELQRGISSRRTLLSSLSFQRQRSNGTLINGSIVSRNGNVDIGCGHSQGESTHHNASTNHHPISRNGNNRISKENTTTISNMSQRTQRGSFNSSNNKHTKEEEFLNKKNSTHHHISNHGSSSLKDSHCNTSKEASQPADTHICICSQKSNSTNLGVVGGATIDNHV